MRLAIADPPYPPAYAERHDLTDGSARRTMRSRAVRYYGGAPGSADHHPAAAEWDDPARHRRLLVELLDEFDGWAIATCPDGLEAYAPIPAPARIMAWFRPNAAPSGHRIRACWEPVIVYPPRARRSRASGVIVPDVLTASAPRAGFTGAKPEAWTHWVLAALGYDAELDTVTDLFPGSGAISAAITQGVLL